MAPVLEKRKMTNDTIIRALACYVATLEAQVGLTTRKRKGKKPGPKPGKRRGPGRPPKNVM